MKLTHRLTIATTLSATLATALIVGPAMAATSDDNQSTGPTPPTATSPPRAAPTGPPQRSSTRTSWPTTPSW